jgi:hypothetical protein
MILLCNNKRTVYEKPYAYREPMCASGNCQWCGELYFAVSAISIGDDQGQGQGYITTNNQSVSMSWCRAQSRTIDQSLLSP